MMSRSKSGHGNGSRRSGPHHEYYAPVAWIAILLGCWLLISEWQILPSLISHTMAALH